jgi:hypothetical protein
MFGGFVKGIDCFMGRRRGNQDHLYHVGAVSKSQIKNTFVFCFILAIFSCVFLDNTGWFLYFLIASCGNNDSQGGGVMTVQYTVIGLTLYFFTFLFPTLGWGQGGIARWNTPKITITLDESSFRGSGIEHPMAEALSAARTWERASAHVPRFEIRRGEVATVGYADNDGRNTIVFYRNRFPTREQPVLALTLQTQNTRTGEILDADIIFDGEHNRYATLKTSMLGALNAPNDFRNVLTHEFGHVLGLTEDRQNQNATMFYLSEAGDTRKIDLDTPDIRSVTDTYERNVRSSDLPGFVLTRLEMGLYILAAILCLFSLGLTLITLLKRKERDPISSATFLVAALLLIMGFPPINPRATQYGLVVSTRSFWRQGMICTRATLQTNHGLEDVERLGGQIGNYLQEVLDAPSGHKLKPGAYVPRDH